MRQELDLIDTKNNTITWHKEFMLHKLEQNSVKEYAADLHHQGEVTHTVHIIIVQDVLIGETKNF